MRTNVDVELAGKRFPERLRTLREYHGWSQRDLAERLPSGAKLTSKIIQVHKWESGETMPGLSSLYSLASALGVPVAYLTGSPVMNGTGMPDWTEVGLRIRAVREAQGMIQAELGTAIGTDHTYISKVESGKRTPSIHIDRLLKIARVLSLPSIDFLLFGPPGKV